MHAKKTYNKPQTDWEHGTIWILDEETWTWTKEERGEK